jgi:ATP-dependent exoDNAse (exonuclease V) beta subunit
VSGQPPLREPPSVQEETSWSADLLQPVPAGHTDVDERTEDRERDPPRQVWRVVPAVSDPHAPHWVIGKLVHEALAAWRFPDDRYEEWVESRARGYGVVDPGQLRHAARHSRKLLERFQDHELFREMDTADRRLHEVPYSRIVEGRVENGIIDALYLRDATWTVVEFKTDELEDQADLDRLLEREDYLTQAQRYVAAVEHLMGQRPRSILCLLDYDGRMRLEQLEDAEGEPSP